jgi:hypothetical protein
VTMHVHEESRPDMRRHGSFVLLAGVAGITLALSLLVSLVLGSFGFVGVLWAGAFVLSGTVLSLFFADRVLRGQPSWLRVGVSLVGGWALSAPLEGLTGLVTRESGETAFLPTVWLWGLIPLLIAEAVVIVHAVRHGRAR